MFLTRSFFALSCLAYAGFAYANSDCATADSHAGQRECLERAASASRAELEKARASLAKRIQAWDEASDYRQRSLRLLTNSFMRFERFRDAECEYEAASAAGGNGAGDMRLECKVSLNRAYTESLRQQFDWYRGHIDERQ